MNRQGQASRGILAPTTRARDAGCARTGGCARKAACRACGSDDVVGAVAERPVVRALAAAQVDGFRGLGDEAVVLQGRRLVRSIAERLLGRAPARAPEIGSSG